MDMRQQFFELTQLGLLSEAKVETLCGDAGISAIDACDAIALSMAEGYLGGVMSWRAGDAAMTRLFEWAYRTNGPGLSDFAWLVYSAFVVGEERHLGQPADSGAEFYSVPLLQLACRRARPH